MKNNLTLVYVSAPKLVGIDSVLPLLLEVYDNLENINIIIVYYDDKNKKLIESNSLFNEIINNKFKTVVSRKSNAIFSLFNIIKLFRFTMFKKTIILKEKDMLPKHKSFINILKRVSNVTEILFSTRSASYELLQYFTFEKKFQFDKGRIPKVVKKPLFDYLMSNLSLNEIKSVFDIEVNSNKFINVGYPKTYSVWNEKIQHNLKFKDDELLKKPYVVMYLTRLDKRSEHFDEPEIKDLVIDTFSILKQYEDSFTLVLKPHPITDMNVINDIIEEQKLTNYIVSNQHHAILAKEAEFVILNHFSTLIPDINYLNIPVVLYHSPDSILKSNEHYKKLYKNCINYNVERDKERLSNVIKDIIEKKLNDFDLNSSYLNQSGIKEFLNLLKSIR